MVQKVTVWNEYDADSVDSFGPKAKKAAIKVAWGGGNQVDQDNFLKMQQEYMRLKQEDVTREKKLKQLAAELQRTQEAAKRALVMQHEPDQHGNLMPKAQTKRLMQANRLLGLEQEISRLDAANRDLQGKLQRKHKEATDATAKLSAAKQRLAQALKDVHTSNQQVARLEQQVRMGRAGPGTLPLGASQTMTADEARASAQRHDQLMQEMDDLRDENERLRNELGMDQSGSADQDDKIEALEAQLSDALDKLGQSLTSQARSVSTAPATNNLEEWVLAETEMPDGTRLLVDQATQYVYSNPRSAREWPQPLGPLTPDGQVLENRLERLMSAWSRMLNTSSLRDVFMEHDTDGSGSLGRPEVKALLIGLCTQGLEGSAKLDAARSVQDSDLNLMLALLDSDGNGQISYQELRAGLVAVCGALEDAKDEGIKQAQLTGQLQQAIERNRGELVQKFSSAQSSSAQPRGNDSAGSASVSLHAACEILSAGPFAPGGQQATPDACAARWRLLMLMLVNWDASGQGRVSAVQVLRMLKLVKLRKQQEPSVQPQTAPSHDHTSPASSRQLAEAHIFIRKLQRDIDTLQGELADANNRLAQWEDMISSTQVDVILTGNREQDEVIRNTQKRSEQISRNYRTTKAQLEELKTRQAVLAEELKETYEKLMESERKCRDFEQAARQKDFSLTDQSRLQSELERMTSTRRKLEDSAFRETHQLQDQVVKITQEKAEVERQLRTATHELTSAQEEIKRVHDNMQSRLQTEVYQLGVERDNARAEVKRLQAEVERLKSMLNMGSSTLSGRQGVEPEQGIRSGSAADNEDVDRLVQTMERDRAELTKLKRQYEAEAALNIDLSATNQELSNRSDTATRALEKECEMLRAKVDRLQQQIKSLTAKLESKGLQGMPQDVQTTSDADDLAGLEPDQNIFEVAIKTGELKVDPDVATFFTLDFFNHPTQVSTKQTGRRPNYDTTIQFIVPMDFNFLYFLTTNYLTLELNQALGSDFSEIGVAQLSLQEVKKQLECSSGSKPHTRNLRLLGAGNSDLGTITVTYRMLRPLQPFVREHQVRLAQQKALEPTAFARFAARAQRYPASASGIRVTIHRCTDLVSPSGDDAQPYVQYEFPGYPRPVDTAFGRGLAPEFEDVNTFAFGDDPQSAPEFARALRDAVLQVVVFDGNADGAAGDIGLANISLRCMVEEARGVSARFELKHPETQAPAGFVAISIQWTHLLEVPRSVPAPSAQPLVPAARLALLQDSALEEGETVLEVTIISTDVQAHLLGAGDKVHAVFSFFNHPVTSTPALPGNHAQFDYSVEYRLALGEQLLQYMEDSSLEVQFSKLAGWSAKPIAVAKLPLKDVINAFAAGQGIDQHRVVFHASIIGQDGAQLLGTCRLGFRSSHPVKEALETFRARPTGFQSSRPALSAPNPEGLSSPRKVGGPASGSAGWATGGAGAASGSPEPYRPFGNAPESPMDSTMLAVKAPANPATWPEDTDNSLVICIEAVQLFPQLLNDATVASCSVFWTLLDAMLDADLESSDFQPKSGALLSFQQATVYHLRGVTAEQRQAQRLLLDKLQNGRKLMFGLAALAEEGGSPALVGQSDELELHEFMSVPHNRWRSNRIPMYNLESTKHVADLTVTIVAQRALRSLWNMRTED